MKLTGEPSLGLLFRYLSASRLVSIAQIEGSRAWRWQRIHPGVRHAFCRARVGDLRSVRAGVWCDSGRGRRPTSRALMGRGRALEVMLSAQDYDADLAERYGWINRALPAANLTISSDRSPIGSPVSRRWATPSLRSASTRSPSVSRGHPSRFRSLPGGHAHE